MQINDVGMTRNHFQNGDIARVRLLVLHATAGRYPGDYNWLRQGGSINAPVSIHYYIDKAGTISRMVADKNIAWHAGQSTWVVDGKQINYSYGCNPVAIGIELENLNNGRDPYPQAQYDAALWLSRQLVAQYNIPRSQMVRHLDIAPQRKTDPRAFPWERFVAEVYTEQPEPPSVPEPLPPRDQLRRILVDLAYCSAGTSCPDRWPLLRETISRQTGMPIVAITPVSKENDNPDVQERAIKLEGQPPLVVEAYGRDLFYAPVDTLDQMERLSDTPNGLLRDVLLDVLFRTIDPTHGFQPDWAFHQFYLKHMTAIGVPISPSYRLTDTTSDGRTFACQHFALDTLCSPVGEWHTIIRLSDLTRGMYRDDPHEPWERELRLLLLNDLYRQRTGRTFDPAALFCQYAITQHLGAPLGKAEYVTIDDYHLVAMPFALDVIYCRVPDNGAWRGVTVNDLPELLSGEQPDPPDPKMYIARLSTLLKDTKDVAVLPDILGVLQGKPAIAGGLHTLPAYTGAWLGREATAPVHMDLSVYAKNGAAKGKTHPDCVVIYPAAGPASIDLASVHHPGNPLWHYYVARQGVVTRLFDEHHRANGERPTHASQDKSGQHSLAIAVEGGTANMSPDQHKALVWLLRDVMQRFHLKRDQIWTTGQGYGG